MASIIRHVASIIDGKSLSIIPGLFELTGALILSYLSFDIRQDASFTKARFAEHSTSIFFLKQLSKSESWGITSSIIVQFATKRFV